MSAKVYLQKKVMLSINIQQVTQLCRTSVVLGVCQNVTWYQAVAHSTSMNFMELSALEMKTGRATTTPRCLNIINWLGYVFKVIIVYDIKCGNCNDI